MPVLGVKFERKRHAVNHASVKSVIAREKSANLKKIDTCIIGVCVCVWGLSENEISFRGVYRPASRSVAKGWESTLGFSSIFYLIYTIETLCDNHNKLLNNTCLTYSLQYFRFSS